MRNTLRSTFSSVTFLLIAAAAAPAFAQCPPTFTVSGPWPMGNPGNAAVGDFDGDGKLDLASANFNTDNVTVRFASTHTPAGTNYDNPVALTIGLNPATIVTGDFNNDGRTDVACAQGNGGATRIAVFISNGNRTFQPPVFYARTPPRIGLFADAADITRDGIDDIVVTYPGGIAVLPGHSGAWTGGGNDAFFIRLLDATPNTFALLDLNLDGALDVTFPQSDPSAVRVALGAPPASASFGASTTYPTGFFGANKPAAGDFNNDGRQDLVLTHSISGRVQVVLSNGNGSLAAQTGQSAGGASALRVVAADFNGDGRLDAAATHSGGVSVHLGDGAGGLSMPTNFAASSTNDVIVADMNNDGRPDIVASSPQAGTYTIFLNTTLVTLFTTQPFEKRVCPGGGSSASFHASATTTQTGGITGYRWERRVGGEWETLNNGVLAGVGTIATATTNMLQVGGVQGNPGDTVMTVRAVALNSCGGTPSDAVTLSIISPCGGADVGATGGVFTGCGDGFLDNNDFVVFIDLFFTNNVIADVGSQGGVPGADGRFDNNDFVVFIDMFFSGCTM